MDEQGRLDLEQLSDAISDQTAIVSIMHANNETGVIFPLDEIAAIVKPVSYTHLDVYKRQVLAAWRLCCSWMRGCPCPGTSMPVCLPDGLTF